MHPGGIVLRLLQSALTLSAVLMVTCAWAGAGTPPNRQPLIAPNPDLFPLYAACATANNRSLTYCTDWLTGPASSENSQLQMYYGDRNKKPWLHGDLLETDIGRPVMSPAGKELVLMVFGDTFVAKPGFTLQNHRQAVAQCMTVPANSFCAYYSSGDQKKHNECLDLFVHIQPKANACTYFFAPWRRIPVFDNQNNVTIFEAEIDTSSAWNIKFKSHLYNKMIRHGPHEGIDPFGNAWFTGVYGIDYFYLCPGTATDCEDDDKLLYLLAQTVFWEPTQGSPSKDQKLSTKLSRAGIGFYRFGKLDASKSKTEGCRIRYGPGYANPPAVMDASCPASLSQWLQPKHAHTTKLSVVERPDNVHVFWGHGGKFGFAVVAHGHIDPYHAGRPSSSNYIYFIGSTETNSQNQHTGKVYLARLPRSEYALINAKFEYFLGVNAGGGSQWGGYQDAVSVLNTLVHPLAGTPVVTSFTKRFGSYYLAATCFYDALTLLPAYGMCTASSKDGIEWSTFDFALYTDIVLPGFSPVKLGGVYGHMWVPEAVYSAESEIAYLFSVWKSPQGYFKEFYRPGGPAMQIKAEHLFYSYNPKMFLYRPPGN